MHASKLKEKLALELIRNHLGNCKDHTKEKRRARFDSHSPTKPQHYP